MPDTSVLIKDYQSGLSLREISRAHGVPVSTARAIIRSAGCLRSRADGFRIAHSKGLLGSRQKGRHRKFSDAHKENISKGRAAWAEKNAKGTSKRPSGYEVYTMGPHKGRSVHVVLMETRIGRRILPDEHVHHIDGNKLNNDLNNLALVTVGGHARIHRREEQLSNNVRDRSENGRFI